MVGGGGGLGQWGFQGVSMGAFLHSAAGDRSAVGNEVEPSHRKCFRSGSVLLCLCRALRVRVLVCTRISVHGVCVGGGVCVCVCVWVWFV